MLHAHATYMTTASAGGRSREETRHAAGSVALVRCSEATQLRQDLRDIGAHQRPQRSSDVDLRLPSNRLGAVGGAGTSWEQCVAVAGSVRSLQCRSAQTMITFCRIMQSLVHVIRDVHDPNQRYSASVLMRVYPVRTAGADGSRPATCLGRRGAVTVLGRPEL